MCYMTAHVMVDKIVDEKSGLSIELRVDYDYAYIFTYDISTGELRDSLKVWTWMKSLGSIYKGIPMAMPTIVDQSLWIRFDKDTTYVARGGKVAAEQYGNKVLKCLNDLDAVDFIRSSTSSETGREQSCLVEIIDNRIQIIRNE